MSLADRIAARLQPVIDAKIAQARYEIENVTPTPDRETRDRINAEHDAAERRGR